MDVSLTDFEILTHKARKLLVFPTFPCLTFSLMGNQSEYLDETYPAKTSGWGYRAVKISKY